MGKKDPKSSVICSQECRGSLRGYTTSASWELQRGNWVGQYLMTCSVSLCYSRESLTVPNKFLPLVTLEDAKQGCPGMQLPESNSMSPPVFVWVPTLYLHSTQHNPTHFLSSSHRSHFLFIYLLTYFGLQLMVCWCVVDDFLRVLLLKWNPFISHLFCVRNQFTYFG